jgi:hypothetical protein
MISFSRPGSQDRFHATLYELIRMRFSGTILVDGGWDAYDALAYLEARMRMEIIPTLRANGSLFFLNGKYVQFTDDCVVVTTSRAELSARGCLRRTGI